MARIVTVQVPQFAVEAYGTDLVFAMPRMSLDLRGRVWNTVGQTKELGTFVQVVCQDEAQAKELLSFLPETDKTVLVDSFTKDNVTYAVKLDSRNTPISCNCPHFINHSKENPHLVCKHMHVVSTNPKYYWYQAVLD
jgi:hypothetical protein